VLLLLLSVIGLAYLWLQQRDKQKEREALLLREKVESQYEALKSQINPHFLFNSFNTLITIIEENPELGVVYVEKLSDFYRSILQYREQQLIGLEEELRLVHDYIFLLQQRFGEHLQLQVEVDKPARYYVAPLALQMLVENAVKHNVISRSKPLYISVRVEGNAILVRNNRQAKLTKAPSTGFGLQNIITRYRLLSEQEVQVAQTDHTFEVALPALQNGRTS
jgi:LytS/YehU family sensor histidine kinase